MTSYLGAMLGAMLPAARKDFDPSIYAVNHLAHWDASDNSTLDITDDGGVAVWRDLSPSARHALQPVGIAQPLYVAASEVGGGLPALRSDAVQPEQWMKYPRWARDIEGLTTQLISGKVVLFMGQYFAADSVRPIQNTGGVDTAIPHVFCFAWTADTWRWRVDGVEVASGVVTTSFFGNQVPLPGMFFMVAKVRSGGGGNNARIFEQGNIFSTSSAKQGSARGADIDLCEMIYIANCEEGV